MSRQAKLVLRIWRSDDTPLPDELSDLFQGATEHVAEMCDLGFTSGEMHLGDALHGWWEIKRKKADRL